MLPAQQPNNSSVGVQVQAALVRQDIATCFVGDWPYLRKIFPAPYPSVENIARETVTDACSASATVQVCANGCWSMQMRCTLTLWSSNTLTLEVSLLLFMLEESLKQAFFFLVWVPMQSYYYFAFISESSISWCMITLSYDGTICTLSSVPYTRAMVWCESNLPVVPIWICGFSFVFSRLRSSHMSMAVLVSTLQEKPM